MRDSSSLLSATSSLMNKLDDRPGKMAAFCSTEMGCPHSSLLMPFVLWSVGTYCKAAVQLTKYSDVVPKYLSHSWAFSIINRVQYVKASSFSIVSNVSSLSDTYKCCHGSMKGHIQRRKVPPGTYCHKAGPALSMKSHHPGLINVPSPTMGSNRLTASSQFKWKVELIQFSFLAFSRQWSNTTNTEIWFHKEYYSGTLIDSMHHGILALSWSRCSWLSVTKLEPVLELKAFREAFWWRAMVCCCAREVD